MFFYVYRDSRSIGVAVLGSEMLGREGLGMAATFTEFQSSRPGELILEAMSRLAESDALKANIARMRILGHLPIDQIALFLGIETDRVAREWRFIRIWLAREIAINSRPDTLLSTANLDQ